VIVLQFLQVNVRGFCSGLVRFKDSEANGRRKDNPAFGSLISLEAEAKHRAL
jgi:hypothetical protein